MEFYPFAQIDKISPRPLLLIAGADAQTLYFSQRAYDMAKEPKELVILDGATHFDLYDKEQFVNPTVDKLADFFRQNLQ